MGEASWDQAGSKPRMLFAVLFVFLIVKQIPSYLQILDFGIARRHFFQPNILKVFDF